MEDFTESGMHFRNGYDQICWRPEQCNTFRNMNGVKMCDLVIQKGNAKLFFTEAKSSNPKRLQDYVNEIVEKLENGVGFFYSHGIGRMRDTHEPLPQTMESPDIIQNGTHQLLLVIRNARQDWLPQIQETFNQNGRVNRLKQIKQIKSFMCLNEALARKKELIH
jgi:hypothetical protein